MLFYNMDLIQCSICKGSGFVKNKQQLFCDNNKDKLSSHLCYKCENIRDELKCLWKLCENCFGDGSVKSKKSIKQTKNYENIIQEKKIKYIFS